MSVCLRVLSSHSDLMKDVFGELSRTALVSMLAANDRKNSKEGRNEVSTGTFTESFASCISLFIV